MTELDQLAALVPRMVALLQGEDDPAARAEAAEVVDRLRPLIAGEPVIANQPVIAHQLADALRVFADWLRAPTPASSAQAEQAIAGLQAAWPVAAPASPSPDDYRQKARSAMDDYFRANPHKPFKP